MFASRWHPGGCGACDNANDGLEVSCGSEPFDADYASTLAGVAQYQPGYDRDGDAHDEQTRTGRPDPRNAGCSSSR